MSGSNYLCKEFILHANRTKFSYIKSCRHVFEVRKSVRTVIETWSEAKSTSISVHFFKETHYIVLVFEMRILGYIGVLSRSKEVNWGYLIAISFVLPTFSILDHNWYSLHFFRTSPHLFNRFVVQLRFLNFLSLTLFWGSFCQQDLFRLLVTTFTASVEALQHIVFFKAMHRWRQHTAVIKLLFTVTSLKYKFQLFISVFADLLRLIFNFSQVVIININVVLCE